MAAIVGLALLGWAVSEANAARAADVTYEVDNLNPAIVYNPPLAGKRAGTDEDPNWEPNQAKNAWNTSFLDNKYRMYDVRKIEEKHYTWATFQDGMDAPTAQLTFFGRKVGIVGPEDGFKPDIGRGEIDFDIDGKHVGSCSENQDAVRLRCDVDVEYGLHTFTVRVKSGAFAIDHFDVYTGTEE